MFVAPSIVVQNLCFSIRNTLINFDSLNLSFKANKRYGIVGDNGVGKSTLLKLIANQITPHRGQVYSRGDIVCLPQETVLFESQTVAEVLGVNTILDAIERIINGSVAVEDYDCVGDQWDVAEQTKNQLAHFQCEEIDLNSVFSDLSGGQKTKILLVKTLFSPADIVLLDEPTNHLDSAARLSVFQWLKETNKTVLVVSHDRALLEAMDDIVEITVHQVNQYGGNYSFYLSEKLKHQAALVQQIEDAKKQFVRAKRSVQQSKEKHDQKAKKGKKLRRTGSIDKLSANSLRGRSEKTLARNNVLSERMMHHSTCALKKAKSQLVVKKPITADLSGTSVANGKTLLDIFHLTFGYEGQPLLFRDFNLTLVGPKRIAITGSNGSGKSTLLQLILGELNALSGEICLGVDSICYLDQNVELLNPSQTVIENYLAVNQSSSEQEAYDALASLGFRQSSANKEVMHLSGGERVRVGLAIALLAYSPQLMILDEPSNHLDIASVEALEEMLAAYNGALIVVSHDSIFLERIHIDAYVEL